MQRRAGGKLAFCMVLLSGRVELAARVESAAAKCSASTQNSAITTRAYMEYMYVRNNCGKSILSQ